MENTEINVEVKEQSFEENLALAKALSRAIDRREEYPKMHGGSFDTFAESFANLPEYREPYDKLCDEAEKLRKEFAEKVADKKEFVQKAREAGEDEIAGLIGMMFSVPKEKLLSRIFKKGK